MVNTGPSNQAVPYPSSPMSRYDDYGRGRSRSRSRGRSDYGRGGGGGGGGFEQRRVSLLCRNLSYDTKDEDVRRLFSKYGDVKDVYIPMNYYTKEPQGYAFIEFYDEKDAEYARRKLDRERLNGREIAVIYAKQQRKKPEDMKRIEDTRQRSRSPRRRSRSRSRDRRRSRSRSPRARDSPRRRDSRSRSPRRSPSRSPRRNSRSPEAKPRARSPEDDRGDDNGKDYRRSPSPEA